MVSYLKHERKVLERQIKGYYDRNKDEIPQDIFKAPLRELTYEDTCVISSTAKGLVVYVDTYIHKYNLKLGKDVTLEDALKKII